MKMGFITCLLDQAVLEGAYELLLIPGQRPRIVHFDSKRSTSFLSDTPVLTQDVIQHFLSHVQDGHYASSDTRWRVTSMTTSWGTLVILRRVGYLFAPRDYPCLEQRLRTLIERAVQEYGVYILCGPVGSGKSSLLSALMVGLLERGHSVLIYEDPPEFDYSGVHEYPGALFMIRQRPEYIDNSSHIQPLLRMMGAVDIFFGEIRSDSLDIAFRLASMGKRVWLTTHSIDIRQFLMSNQAHQGLKAILTTHLVPVRSSLIPNIGILYLHEFQHVLSDPNQLFETWKHTTDLPISVHPLYHAWELVRTGIIPEKIVPSLPSFSESVWARYAQQNDHHPEHLVVEIKHQDILHVCERELGFALPMTITVHAEQFQDSWVFEQWFPTEFEKLKHKNPNLWFQLEETLREKLHTLPSLPSKHHIQLVLMRSYHDFESRS